MFRLFALMLLDVFYVLVMLSVGAIILINSSHAILKTSWQVSNLVFIPMCILALVLGKVVQKLNKLYPAPSIESIKKVLALRSSAAHTSVSTATVAPVSTIRKPISVNVTEKVEELANGGQRKTIVIHEKFE